MNRSHTKHGARQYYQTSLFRTDILYAKEARCRCPQRRLSAQYEQCGTAGTAAKRDCPALIRRGARQIDRE
jgi:hypothetical protein